jgi:triosephosphate isomerase (TIM)
LFHFIVNSKNYENAAGEFAPDLARAASEFRSSSDPHVEIYLAVPAFSVFYLSSNFPRLQILTQHLDDAKPGSTTGYLVPKIAKISGAKGSLINHSEHRLDFTVIEILVRTLRDLGMKSVVCAQDEAEVEMFAKLEPDFVAIEPPELIGSGKAVSKARPELITDSLQALKRGSAGKREATLLCGAGIVEPQDVSTAVRLGANGILVASGVIKANDWRATIQALGDAFTGER